MGQENTHVSSTPVDLTSAKGEVDEVRLPSSLSHRSQESTWRPFSGPNEAWVQRRLLRLAAHDDKDSLDLESQHRLMIRAFHPMDWRKEGRILRRDVVDAWEPATVTVNAKISASNLLWIAKKGDSNQDGEINQNEFINICNTIVDEIKKIHEQSLRELLADSSAETSSSNEFAVKKLRISNPAQAPLPGAGNARLQRHFTTLSLIMLLASPLRCLLHPSVVWHI